MGLERLREVYRIDGERQVLITEVTRMSGGLICAAGLDIHVGTMVRPLQGNGTNWEEAEWVTTGYMHVGNVLSFVSADQGHPDYPHASEDFRVSQVKCLGQVSQHDLYEACHETAYEDMESIFDGNLIENKYVVAGTCCRSLGCIMLPRRKIKIQESYGKIQVSYLDKNSIWHNLKITDLVTKNYEEIDAGMEALKNRLACSSVIQPIVLRLGLARPWAGTNSDYNPKRCYVQANGIIFPDQ